MIYKKIQIDKRNRAKLIEKDARKAIRLAKEAHLLKGDKPADYNSQNNALTEEAIKSIKEADPIHWRKMVGKLDPTNPWIETLIKNQNDTVPTLKLKGIPTLPMPTVKTLTDQGLSRLRRRSGSAAEGRPPRPDAPCRQRGGA